MSQPKKALIIGISGGLAKITAHLLTEKYPGIEIIGIDMRSTSLEVDIPKVKIFKMKYTRSHFEKIFRDHEFDFVFHLGRLSHSRVDNVSMAERLDVGLTGTQRLLDLSLKAGVQKIVMLSTFHVYGALSDNSAFINEDMPLRASHKYGELRDVVDMDQITSNWMWKHQNEVSCVIFRPCNIIGPQVMNTMSQYLAYEYSPFPIDYNPMFQFIHEYDMAKLIVAATDKIPTGLYNASYNDVIPLRKALDIAGNKGVPTMFGALKMAAKIMKTASLKVPEYLIDYLMYSCIIDNQAIMKHLDDNFFRFTTEDALRSLRLKA